MNVFVLYRDSPTDCSVAFHLLLLADWQSTFQFSLKSGAKYRMFPVAVLV